MFDNSLSSNIVKKLLVHLIFGEMVKIFNFSVGCHIQIFAFLLDFQPYLLFGICVRGPKTSNVDSQFLFGALFRLGTCIFKKFQQT